MSTLVDEGRVLDGMCTAVPDAQVVLENVASGTVRKTAANSEGEYRFTDMPPTKYRITASTETFMPEGLDKFNGTVMELRAFAHATSQSVRAGEGSSEND